jgi:hypothetical protein
MITPRPTRLGLATIKRLSPTLLIPCILRHESHLRRVVAPAQCAGGDAALVGEPVPGRAGGALAEGPVIVAVGGRGCVVDVVAGAALGTGAWVGDVLDGGVGLAWGRGV